MKEIIAFIALHGSISAVSWLVKRGLNKVDADKMVRHTMVTKHNQIEAAKKNIPDIKDTGAKNIGKKTSGQTESITLSKTPPKPAGKENLNIEYGEQANLGSKAKIDAVKRIVKNKASSPQEIDKKKRALEYLTKHNKPKKKSLLK